MSTVVCHTHGARHWSHAIPILQDNKDTSTNARAAADAMCPSASICVFRCISINWSGTCTNLAFVSAFSGGGPLDVWDLYPSSQKGLHVSWPFDAVPD